MSFIIDDKVSGPGTFNVKTYGAKGDGVADDTAAIQTALNAAVAISAPTSLYFPPGTYRTTAPISVDTSKRVRMFGDSASLVEIKCDGQFLVATGVAAASTTVSVAAKSGDLTVTVASTAGLAVGQLMRIYSTQNMPETAFVVFRSHTAIVTAIGVGTVTMDRSLPIDFDVPGFTVTVNAFSVGSISIGKMTVSGQYNGYFLDVACCKGLRIEDVTFLNRQKTYQGALAASGTMSVVRIMYSVDTVVDGCRFEYIQYGVMPTHGSVGCTVRNSSALQCRHIAAPTGGSQKFRAVSLDSYHCYAGLDSHQCAYDSSYYGCNDYGNEIAAKFRGRHDVVDNCFFDGEIYLEHDGALQSLASKDGLRKTLLNSRVRGSVVASAQSVHIGNCTIYGMVTNWLNNVGESFILENSEIYYQGQNETGKYQVLWLGFRKQNVIRNVRIYGPYRGVDNTAGVVDAIPKTAIYIERNATDGGTVHVSNVLIDGFDYGIHFPLTLDLRKWTFSDLEVRNCVVGIHNNTNYKDYLTFDGVFFRGCGTNVTEPFRFRFATHTNRMSDMQGRSVWMGVVPTMGDWLLTDKVYNSSPTAGGALGWVCVRAGKSASAWVASKAYVVGDVVVPTADNGYYYECTVAGTSAVTEPTWPTGVNATVADGGATWQRKLASALFKPFGLISE